MAVDLNTDKAMATGNNMLGIIEGVTEGVSDQSSAMGDIIAITIILGLVLGVGMLLFTMLKKFTDKKSYSR